MDTSGAFRPASFLQDAVDGLGVALLVGLLIAVLLFWVLFRSWRVAVIALVAITTTVMAAGVVLYLLDSTLNISIFAGIVLGVSVIVGDIVEDSAGAAAPAVAGHRDGD